MKIKVVELCIIIVIIIEATKYIVKCIILPFNLNTLILIEPERVTFSHVKIQFLLCLTINFLACLFDRFSFYPISTEL